MRFWSLILLVITISTLEACYAGVNSDAIKIKDQIGRVIKLNKIPQRVVSLAPSLTEIIFSLGAQDRLVGVTKYSDYPKSARSIPIVGSYLHLDLEKILILEPDLCIAIKGGNSNEIIHHLELLGIPVYIVNPKDINSVLSTIFDVGVLLNTETEATVLIDSLKCRIDYILATIAKAENKPRIFFQLGNSPIVSAGNHTFIDDIIHLVNGTNVVRGLGQYPRLNREDVLDFHPDIIIIVAEKDNNSSLREKFHWEVWKKRSGLLKIRVFVENADLFDRPSPRLIDGLELLARRIHPDLFEESL